MTGEQSPGNAAKSGHKPTAKKGWLSMTNTKEELRSMMKGIRNDLELAFAGEPVDLWEYLVDGLALDYRVGPDKSPIACRVWFTLGGPNIWVDTETDSIHGAWGSDREEIYIDSELSDAILESMTSDWDCY